MAALEEFLQQKYVELYEGIDENANKVEELMNIDKYSEFFYIPSKEGVGGLRYLVDSEGHALYLIKKSGLPQEIKEQLVGGEAGEGTYGDYVSLNDVYGVTKNLKVYYCAGGLDTIHGLAKEELDNDNPDRKVFESSSNLYGDLGDYDIDGDETITAEELKSVREFSITKNSKITDLKELYNLTSLEKLTIQDKELDSLEGIQNCVKIYYICFENCTIKNYSSLGGLGSSLMYCYLYNVNDDELNLLCDGIKNSDFSKLQYFGVYGNKDVFSQGIEYNNDCGPGKSEKTITTLKPLEKLSKITKESVKYLLLNNNNIADSEEVTNLQYIKDFKNVYLLDIERNKFQTLDGLENMENLTYLFATTNELGKNRDSDEPNEEIDCLASLKNLKKLYLFRANDCRDLRNVDYLKNSNNLRFLYLSGCNKLMNVNNISQIIINCGTNYSLPCKFLSGSVYDISTYYTPSKATYGELKADLYNNTYINQLNISSCTITDEQLNEILSSMSNLKYLNVNKTNLEHLNFIPNDKTSKLEEIRLLDTNVVDDIGKLEFATNLKCGVINNSEIDLTKIQETLSRSIYNSSSKFRWLWILHNKCNINTKIKVLYKFK